jgi:hypothetical protein
MYMRKELVIPKNCTEISQSEAASISGGNGIGDFLRCVRGTLLNGTAGKIRTIVLGTTLWGMARTMGVLVGCGT